MAQAHKYNLAVRVFHGKNTFYYELFSLLTSSYIIKNKNYISIINLKKKPFNIKQKKKQKKQKKIRKEKKKQRTEKGKNVMK